MSAPVKEKSQPGAQSVLMPIRWQLRVPGRSQALTHWIPQAQSGEGDRCIECWDSWGIANSYNS